MSGHGPDADMRTRQDCGTEATVSRDTLVFLFETQLPIRPTRFALETELLERDYYTHWQGLKKNFGLARARAVGSEP